MGFRLRVIVDPTVVTMLVCFVLRRRIGTVPPGIIGVRTALGVPARRAGIPVEIMVFPAGIAPARQDLSAGVALGIIAVLVAVLILADLRSRAVRTSLFLLMPADTVAARIAVILPAAVPPALFHLAAFRTLALIAVHLLVLYHIGFSPVMRAGSVNRCRNKGGNCHDDKKKGKQF